MYSTTYNTTGTMAMLFVMMALMMLLNSAMIRIERKLLRWKPRSAYQGRSEFLRRTPMRYVRYRQADKVRWGQVASERVFELEGDVLECAAPHRRAAHACRRGAATHRRSPPRSSASA